MLYADISGHTQPASYKASWKKKSKDILKVWQGTLVSKLDPSSPKKLGYSAYPQGNS